MKYFKLLFKLLKLFIIIIILSSIGCFIYVKTSPKMDFNKWVCRMLVELIVLDMEQNTVFSPIPICSLKMISKRIPKVNKTLPITIEIFKNFLWSISLLINWDATKNRPKRPKNIMSLPFEDPIKNK